MSWQLEWSRGAVRDLRRLDRQTAERVRAAVRHLAATDQGDVRRLTGRVEWRLRVGDWRVLFVYDYATNTLRVGRVVPRGRSYRD